LSRAGDWVNITYVLSGDSKQTPRLLKTLAASKFCSWHRVTSPGGACVDGAAKNPFASIGVASEIRLLRDSDEALSGSLSPVKRQVPTGGPR
jgi:hypothetical protein